MTPPSEWYRCTSWTTADQTEFELRLKRSRGAFHKAQYLCIQAITLLETRRSDLVEPALGLVERVLRDYPDEDQLRARTTRADCLARLGREDEALAAYRNALDWERTHPGHHTESYLDFAELVLRSGRQDLFDEASRALDDFGAGMLFPVSEFRYSAVRAFLAGAAGDRARASQFAGLALDAARRTDSGLRYHRTLGLVGSDHADTIRRLEGLRAT